MNKSNIPDQLIYTIDVKALDCDGIPLELYTAIERLNTS